MRLRGLTVAAMLAVALTAGTASAVAEAPALDYNGIVSQFMCTECHEPLNQVNSPEAISEKQYLQGLVARGLTLGQIKTAMVAQYGSQVLARPPASGFNLTIYILPPAVFVAGLALLAYTLPKWRARSRRAAVTPIVGAAPLEPDEAKRLDDELTNFI
jgi:cytochrome c-type biogenesis protein CcmH/NrfF